MQYNVKHKAVNRDYKFIRYMFYGRLMQLRSYYFPIELKYTQRERDRDRI